jgi:ribosomal protein L11 methyltransferase
MLKDKKYDLIIANINILLNDMQSYVDCLNQRNPTFKWFYQQDIRLLMLLVLKKVNLC